MGLSPKSNYKKNSFLVLTSGKFLEALGSGIGTGSIFCLSFSLSNRVESFVSHPKLIFVMMILGYGGSSWPNVVVKTGSASASVLRGLRTWRIEKHFDPVVPVNIQMCSMDRVNAVVMSLVFVHKTPIVFGWRFNLARWSVAAGALALSNATVALMTPLL